MRKHSAARMMVALLLLGLGLIAAPRADAQTQCSGSIILSPDKGQTPPNDVLEQNEALSVGVGIFNTTTVGGVPAIANVRNTTLVVLACSSEFPCASELSALTFDSCTPGPGIASCALDPMNPNHVQITYTGNTKALLPATVTNLVTLNLHAEPGQHIVNPTDGKFFIVADTGAGNIFNASCAGSGQGSAPLFYPGVCGDGFADSELGEDCDDGNAVPYDGCGIPGGGANNCTRCAESTPCPDTGNECADAGCNGEGFCDQNHILPNSRPCTDTGNECATAGCNGAGQCDQAHVPALDNTPCADTDGNICTEAACSAGTCNQSQVLPNSKPCPDNANECAAAGCNGAGQCDQSHTPVQDSTPCTDSDNNTCTEAGCEAGACQQAHVMPDSKPCGDTSNECAAAGCDGSGVCDQNHTPVQDGTSCTDTDQSQCTDAACVAGICDQDAGGVVQCQEPECNTCDPGDGVCKAINPAPPQCGTEICPNGADDDGDGLIDCEDPDCDCEPIGEDPGKILFGKPRGAGRDKLMVHGLILPLTAYDPMTEEVGFVLTNDVGLAYTATIPAGNLEQTKFKFKHLNRAAARAKNGPSRFLLSRKFVQRGEFSGYQFNITTYGDLSLATVPRMTFQIRVGDDAFVNTSDWRKMRNGWRLTLPRQ